MLFATQFVTVLIAGLGFLGSAAAAPVQNTTTHELVARGPYDTHNGWASWYNPSAGTGACGWQNQDYEWVAAVGTQLFQELTPDGNPNHSAACGKTATATYNGKTITLGIVDRCPGCGYDDIDLAPAAFQQFADLGVGKLYGFSWRFN
ncbi:unnamed protein product [Rhizoctonia solani]|uniref:RlpA-like protein double-psi beta-barrel domain-containing protein n=1 Tax=Rhizoctonia solani TaxID=456999 RepID=A0A8H3DXS8_9AGAM|nr:unnamed protein product [Rhizoctonia solani]